MGGNYVFIFIFRLGFLDFDELVREVRRVRFNEDDMLEVAGRI